MYWYEHPVADDLTTESAVSNSDWKVTIVGCKGCIC